MRTNIEINDALMEKAMQTTGARTKRAAVEEALELLVKIGAQEGIRELFGKVEFYDDVLAERELSSIE
jgi:Arc/MetJ family transcription regulator